VVVVRAEFARIHSSEVGAIDFLISELIVSGEICATGTVPVSDTEALIAGATTQTFNEAARNLELTWNFWKSS
jgi:hypothetical protein